MSVTGSGEAMRARASRLPVRRDIQGLRAVAVLLVVLDHAGVGPFSGGYVGVDVFFVISGFLITSLLVREVMDTGRISVGGFYARRARRILPVATVVLLVTTFVSTVTMSVTQAREVVEDVLWSSLFLANVHFAGMGTDYFAEDRALSPVQHYWSLAVEEQFYLVLPLLVLLVAMLGRRRKGKRRRCTDEFSRGRTQLAFLVGLLVVASLAWSVVDTALSPASAYFSSLTRAWELGLGVLVALAVPRLGSLSHRLRALLAGVGLAAILGSAVAFDASTPFPGWPALVPVLGTAALLVAGAAADGVGPARILMTRPFTWLGDLSYSLYLWHWPVLVLTADAVSADPTVIETATLLWLVLGLSIVTFHLVEQPFRRGRVPALRGRRALVLWPVAVGAVLLATVMVDQHGRLLMERRVAEADSYYDGVSGDGISLTAGTIPGLVEQSVALADAGAPIHFPLDNLDGLRDDHWAEEYECFATFKDTEAPDCVLGDVAADPTVAVLGDSHMGMWLPALDAIGEADGFKVVPYVKWACPSYDVPTLALRGPDGTCDEFRAWSVEQLRTLDPDVILLSNRALPPNMDAGESELVTTWEEGMHDTLSTMTEIAPTVRVLGDVPRVETDPGDCLSSEGSTMASCTLDATPRSIEGIEATRRAAADAGVPYVDVEPLVCAAWRCPLVVDQIVVYRDNDHISLTWSKRLSEELRVRLLLPPMQL